MLKAASSHLFMMFMAFICAGCSADQTAALRQPNSDEIFYHYAAVAVNEPATCEKISPKAYLTAGWGGEGAQVSLERSECNYEIAIRYARKELCVHVKPINTAFLNGSRYSPGPCRDEIAKHGRDLSYGIELPGAKDLIRIFDRMGYTPQSVIAEKLTVDPHNLFDVYIQIAKDKDTVSRVKGFLKSSRADTIPVRQREMLYDMTGHLTNDIRWCQKIRADALYPDSHYFKNVSHEYFQDTCILEIAYNTRDGSLCDAMPDRPADKDHVITKKQVCSAQLKNPHLISPGAHYGYFVPESEEVVAEILKALDYPLPDWKNDSPEELSNVYFNFLLALEYPKVDNPSYAKAREDFIRRVRTLPDYN